MQGDAVLPVDAVTASLGARVQAISEMATRTCALRDRLSDDLRLKEQEIVDLYAQAEKLAKVGELYRALMDKLVEQQKTVVEGLVTQGLRAIFLDQDMSFEADVVQRANRVEIDLFFKRGSGSFAVRDHPLEGFGGGTTSICSVILRILAMRRLGRFPLLVLDETLPAVSAEYVDHTGRFLQKLCASMGIDVLFVTHVPDFLAHADVAYEGHEEAIEGGANLTRLTLRKLRARA